MEEIEQERDEALQALIAIATSRLEAGDTETALWILSKLPG